MNALAAIGLGLDIAGALILAAGLLASPAIIRLRASTFWGGFTAPAAYDGAESRADAEWGLSSLTLGFLCQIAALAADGAVVNETVGLAIAAAVHTMSLASWRFWWRPRRRLQLLTEVARVEVTNQLDRPLIRGHPSGSALVAFGALLGKPREDDEPVTEFAKRVFGVGEAVDDLPQDNPET